MSKERYNGKGVLKAINNVNTIINDSLKDKDVLNQKEIDEALIKLDGSNNKSNLGANAILGVSIACLKAACNSKKEYLFKFEISILSPSSALIARLRSLVIALVFISINSLLFSIFVIFPALSGAYFFSIFA